jgi:hypothetical protein
MKIASVPNLLAAIPTDAKGDVMNRIRWIYRKSVPNVPSPLLYEGVFYAIKDGGIATAFHAESGDVIKEGRFAPAFGTMFASPVAGDGKIYVVNLFLPVKVLSRVFRGRFVSGLKQMFQKGDLCLPGRLQPLAQRKAFHSVLRTLFRHDWVVYAKRPFGGPEHVLHYLARYTHRVAISNHRLVNFAGGKVTFRWKDYAHGNKSRLMTLAAEEFLRRFLLHVLPRGFVRIRFFGLLANRRRSALLPLCRRLIADNSGSLALSPPTIPDSSSSGSTCPICGGSMIVVERLTAQQLLTEFTRQVALEDTS